MIRYVVGFIILILFQTKHSYAQDPNKAGMENQEQIKLEDQNVQQVETDKTGAQKPDSNPVRQKVKKKADEVILVREKNPFMIPNHLYLNVKSKLEVKKEITINTNFKDPNRIDDSLDAKIRWPLSNYSLMAVIWNVKTPKALFVDKLNKQHIFLIHEKIGNNNGVITAIRNGEVVVKEKFGDTFGDTIVKINK